MQILKLFPVVLLHLFCVIYNVVWVSLWVSGHADTKMITKLPPAQTPT